MTFDRTRNVTVLFGGTGATGALDDTWEWNGVSWTRRTPPLSPPARERCSLEYDPSRAVVVLFGGSHGQADEWTFNGTWTQVTNTTAPQARSGAVMVSRWSLGGLVLFGGLGAAGPLDDMWSRD